MSKLIYQLETTAKKLINEPFVVKFFSTFLERILLSKSWRCSAPQLFIVGLPRSGTTLIYQYIVHRLNVSYFTHGAGVFPHAPCITTFIQHKLYGQYQSKFKSNYGKEHGVVAVSPREAGGVWCRFFDVNDYVENDGLEEKDVRVLRNIIACVQHISGETPFVNKNVKHLLRIGALSKIFPNSRFLVVEREIPDVALSILRGRYKNLSDPRQWWSVRPTNYEKLKDLPIAEQVANQCLSLKKKLENDLLELSPERIVRIQYETFCLNPEGLIQGLMDSIGATETMNPVQQCFTSSRAHPQNDEERNLIALVGKCRNE